MTQTGVPDPQADGYSAVEEPRQSRTYVTIGTILLIILVVIIFLLFWRSCRDTSGDRQSSGGGGVIVDIEGMDAVENGVAIWLKPGADLQEVLSRNGLGDSEAVDMGEGTYVISVSGDAKTVVEKLKDDPGLEDAGFLFTEE